DDHDSTAGQIKGGFCASGTIVENPTTEANPCNPSEEFLFKRMCWNGRLKKGTACSKRAVSKGEVKAAKNWWCRQAFPTDKFTAQDCIGMPWGEAICWKICNTDQACHNKCVPRINEVPNEVIVQLSNIGNGKP